MIGKNLMSLQYEYVPENRTTRLLVWNCLKANAYKCKHKFCIIALVIKGDSIEKQNIEC